MAQETPRFLESPLGALATELEAENAAAPRIQAPSLPQFDPTPQQPQQQAPQQAAGRMAGALPNDPRLIRAFQDASRKHGVPVNVLMALAQQESTYNPYALGQPTQYGRAKGIMQYLDSTARGVGINPFDAEQAIDAAARQYADRIRRGDTPLEAIMAHHGGDNRRQWGPRTQAYGQQVMQRAQDILGAYQQAFPPQPEPAQPQQPQQQAAAPAEQAPAAEPTRSWGEVFTDPAKKFAGSLVGMAGGVIDMLSPDPAPGETGYLDRVRRRVEDANAGIDAAIASTGEYFGLGGLDAIRDARQRSTEHENQRTQARARHDAVARAEGGPTLDERRRQNPINRVADEISGFGDYLRTDAVSEAQRFHDQNLGKAVDSGFVGAARYAVTNPVDFASSVGPETLSYLIPAAGAARITGAAAKAARVPAALAERLAGGAGLAAVGGAATIQNATGVAMEIMDMPDDELRRTSPLFVDLVDKQGLTPAAAKSEMADRAFMRTLTVSGVSNAVTLGVAARFRANVLENWAMGRLGAGAGGARGAAAGAASGFTKEALSEMAQEGGDAVAQGIGEVGGGVRRQEEMFAQVPGSMAVGALASAPGGAVAGAYEGGRHGAPVETATIPNEGGGQTTITAPGAQAAVQRAQQQTQPPAQEPPIAVGTAGRDADTTPGGTIGRAAQAGQQAAVQAGIEAGLNEEQAAPRVTARTPLEGDVAGTLESYREDGQGGWSASILGDDGQLRHYTDKDGVELMRQEGAAQQQQPAAEPQAPAAQQPEIAPEAQAVTPEPAADTAAQIAAIRDPSSGKDAALITPNSARDADLSGLEAVETAQGLFVTSNPEKAAQVRAAAGTLTTDQVGQLLGYTTPKADSDGTVVQARDSQGNVVHQEATNQQRVAEATKRAEEMAPEGGAVETTTADKVQAERAQRVSEDNPLADFTDEDLRDRMRSIAAQVKVQGRTPILVNARRQVEREINRRKGAANAVGNDSAPGSKAAAPAGAGEPAGRSADEVGAAARQPRAAEPVPAVRAPVAGAGATADAQPALSDAHAGKWFGTQEKADAYIAKKGLAGTHEVVQADRRFEVRQKQAATAAKIPVRGETVPAADLVAIKDVYGKTVHVHRTVLDSDRNMLPMYASTGRPITRDGRHESIVRDNLDPDGSKRRSVPGLPYYASTTKDGERPFKTRSQAERAVTDAGQSLGEYDIREADGGFVAVRKPATVEQASADAATSPANDRPEPTQAQKEAGNYAKGHIIIGGLDISIENPAGTRRNPEWPPLEHAYGYVRGSKGADGDHVDVFLGDQATDTSRPVYVIDQVNEDRSFDEHKVVMGFTTAKDAKAAYLANYEDGWNGFGGMRKMSFEEFKGWVADPKRTRKPASATVAPKAGSKPAAVRPAGAGALAITIDPSAKNIRTQDVLVTPPPRQFNLAGKKVGDVLHDIDGHSHRIDEIKAGNVKLTRNPDMLSERTVWMRQPEYDRLVAQHGEFLAASGAAFEDSTKPSSATVAAKPAEAAPSRADSGSVSEPASHEGEPLNPVQKAKKKVMDLRAKVERLRNGLAESALSPDVREELFRTRGQLQNAETQLRIARSGAFDDDAAPAAAETAPDANATWWDKELTGAGRRQVMKAAGVTLPDRVLWSHVREADRARLLKYREASVADQQQAASQATQGEWEQAGPKKRQQMLDATMEKLAKDDAADRAAAAQEQAASGRFANNKLFTSDAVEKARARMRSKLGQLNSGFDPELMLDGITITGAYIEAGVRDFASYAKAMTEDFGAAIRPYLLSFYEGVRNYPELDTEGMTPPAEAARLHAALVKATPPTAEAAGRVVEPPKQRKKATGNGAGRTLRQDWGTDSIDGWTPIEGGKNQPSDYGLRGGVKDAFLADAKGYLREVAAILEQHGLTPYPGRGSKKHNPVSVNEGGPAVSGDVILSMQGREGRGVYAQIGVSALRGTVPTTDAGVSVMFRTTFAGNRYGSGTNQWARADLTAGELAELIRKEYERYTPAVPAPLIEERTNAGDQVRVAEGDAGARTEGVPAADAGRAAGGDAGPAGGRARAESGRRDGRGDGQPEPAGQPAVPARSDEAGAGVRNPEADRAGDRAEPGHRGNRQPLGDYRYQPGELTRDRSWRGVAERNVEAVELVKKLAAENRPATPDERALLARFTGWGASEIANGVFPDPRTGQFKAEWRELGERLRAALTDEEYAAARRSTQYAHYTSEKVVRSIYGALERFGFAGGRVLEPGMGIGLFKGLMPDAIAANSRYHGIEYDPITGAIAKALYPQSNIQVGDFTETALPKGYYDAAIGNPPFSSTKVLNDPEYRSRSFMLHDYFFAKTIDRVKPGGLVVFVTSKGTMDKANSRARQYLADRADLLGAIRLPQTAFKDNAGTEVVTDVLFLQRRAPGAEPNGVSWLGTREVSTPQGRTSINEYFADNPEMVLGSHALTGSMYRKDEYTVIPRDGDIEQHFAEAVQRLPEGIYRPDRGSEAERAAVADREFNPKAKKEGSVYIGEDGQLRIVDQGSGLALTERINSAGKSVPLKPKEIRFLQSYVGLRDALKQSQYDQLNDGDWETSLAALNQAYDAFVKEHGHVLAHSTSERENPDGTTTVITRWKNNSLLRLDAEDALVRALEEVRPDGTIVRGKLLTGRTLNKPTAPTINTVQDALLVQLNQQGRLDMAEVARLAGTTEKDAIEQLGDAIYNDPAKGWITADAYLSGNVVRKLKEARQAAKADPAMRRNVAALEAVQPAPLAPADISAQLGAHWVPASDVAAFASEVIGEKMDVSFHPLAKSWSVEATGGRAVSEWNTEGMPAADLLESTLNNRQIKVTRRVPDGNGGWTTEVDPVATEQANDVAKKMRTQFSRWLWASPQRAERLARFYNEHFNNIVPRSFDGQHLTLPGISSRFNLYPHQKRAIWRAIQDGNTYLAHSVGAGKTFTMIAAGMEERRLGLIKKPMYVVPNHMLAQFAREFQELYPTAHVMTADEDNFHTSVRHQFVARAALNDPDAIIITHSAFSRIGMSEEFSDRYIQDQIAAYEAIKEEAADDRITVKQAERRIEQLEKRLSGKTDASKKDKVLTFEELGVDRLYVDEFHEFRKLDFPTNRGSVKGIDPSGSQRSMDLHMKVQFLEGKNPGRSLVAASGTPVTNTMGELFTAQRFMQPAQLAEDGLDSFDAWSNQFGEVVEGFEQNPSGGYEIVSRFARFVNVPDLMRRVRSFMDILTSEQLGDLVQRPTVEGGGREIVVTPVPEGYKAYQKALDARIKAIRARKGKPQQGDDIILNVIGDGRFSAIDMRFVDPNAAPDPNSKLNRVLDDMIRAYHDTADWEYHTGGQPDQLRGAAMMLFTDIGLGEASAKNRGFDMKAWISKRLIDGGVAPEHIAFMRDNKAHAKKEKLFADMRQGKKRILIGGKDMETGVNAQKRLTDLFHLDAPWFPASVEQREGRIIRQGNQNKQVRVRAYATKGSYDSTMWGMNARKQRFITQALQGNDSIRSMEDVSEASSFEMASALASGDERYLKLAGLRADVERLGRLFSAHEREQRDMRSEKVRLESGIKARTALIAKLEDAIGRRKPVSGDAFAATVDGAPVESREDFSNTLFMTFKELAEANTDGERVIGKIGGFNILYTGHTMKGSGDFVASVDLDIPGDPSALLTYPIDPELPVKGIAARATNQVNGLDRALSDTRARLAEMERRIEQVDSRIGAQFADMAELTEKQTALDELEAELASESQKLDQAQDEAAAAEAGNPAAPQQEEQQYQDIPDTILSGQVPEPRRVQALARLKVLRAQLQRGQIDEAAFVERVSALTDDIDNLRTGQRMRQAFAERARGADWLRERLIRARRNGELNPETIDLCLWLLDQNPNLADDLGISIRAAKEGDSAGGYNKLERIATIFAGNENDGTAIHEILHHSERMMPPEVQDGIVRERRRAWEAAYRKASPEVKTALLDMAQAALGDRAAYGRVLEAFGKGTLDYDRHYPLVNASEYWAVNATDILAGRHRVRGSWIGQARRWLGELIERAKGLFGLRSDAPVLRGLRKVLNGNGERLSSQMLAERAAGRQGQQYRDITDLEDIDLDGITFDTAQADFENNASGDSSASVEAINRLREERELGRVRLLIDRDGSVRPVLGVDAVDAVARDGQVIVQRGVGRDEWTVLSQGAGVSNELAQGKINRARAELAEAASDELEYRDINPQTQTPEFRRWFGNSKVVDANGEPLVVYHGTKGNFSEFKRAAGTRFDGGWFGDGFYLTGSPDLASAYATRERDGSKTGRPANVMPVYVKMENPYRVDLSSLSHAEATDFTNQFGGNAGFEEWLDANGYDGVIGYRDPGIAGEGAEFWEVVVFRPEQIKSATGNAGTFDPSNPDIRFSVAPITAVEQEFRAATGEAPESALTRLAGVEMRNGMRRAGNLSGELEASPYTPEQEALLDQYRAMKNPSSRYLFHTTTPDRLASIMASGLQPNSPQRFEGVSNGRISLSANEAAARYYGADGDVMLRLRKDYQIGDMESDLLAGGDGAYTTGTAIPPEALEIKRGNRWVKLSDATPDIRFSAREAGTAGEAVTSGPFGAAVKRMIDAGQVQVHQQAPAGAPVGAQAWTDARGNIHLLDSVPAEIAPGVLLHEAFHGRVRPLIGEQAWSGLMGELTVLSRRAARDTGALGKAWTDAMERVQAARAQGDPNLMADAMTAEEFGAYAIENAENMPATVKTWAKRLLGAVQAWLLRRFGKQVGEVTPEQLRALAIAALRDAGMAQRTVTRGMEDVRLYSAEQREQALKAAADETAAEPAKAGGDWRGRLSRDISRLRNLLHHPRHIAAIFREFTPVYLTAMDQQSMRDNIITDLNRDYQNYAALPKEAKVRVNAVMELGRLLGKVYTAAELAAGVKNPGYRVAVRYDEQGQPIRYRRPFTATNSKAGETIQLAPEEVAAYGSMRAMFDRALDMFADQAIEEMGFPELRGNREKAKEMLKQMMAEGGNASRLSAAARFLADIEQAKRQGYVPFARYGDYVVAVKRDKANLTYVRHRDGGFLVRGVPHDMHSFMEAIGAKEDQLEDGWRVTAQQRRLLNDENSETLYAERIETGLRDMLPEARAKWMEGKARDIPAVKAAYDRIKAQWAPDGSGNRILEPFAVNKKRPEDGVKLTDLDTLAGVADLDNDTWEAVREKLADAIQAQGFRKHFFNADNVPGYTGDFERAITDYMGGMAGYLSRRAHQDRWDNSINAIAADRLHTYATRYRDYVNSPGEELAALRQAGFLMYIGGSVASGVTNLTQLPMMTFPALGQFANPAKVSAVMARASKDALAMMSAKRTVGLDLFDPKKAPADVRADLVKAWESGDFVPQATFEIMATARNRTAGARRLRRNFDKGAQVFGLTFSVPERINRLTTYIAAYRLAQQPGFRERAAKVYGKNSLAQQMLFAEGKWSPAAFAEFMVDETQYRMGKANRPTIMRGPGAALLQFKGFMMQSLEAWSRMVRYQGKAGKLAAATSIAVMLALGGLWGFPGGEDARDLLEKLLEKMLNRDVDLRTSLRRRLYEATGSQWIAAAADRGIPYAFGLDMGRVGMGRIAPDGGASTGSDTLDSLLLVGGIPADMLIRRPVNALDALRKGEPAGALAALSPTSIRNPIQAAQFATQGVRDSRGRVVMTPEQISNSDIVLKGLGWTPAQVTAMRDYSYAQYRMQTASDAYKARMADQIARTLALISRTQDERTRAELTKQLRETYAEVAAFNASVPAENQVGITNAMIRNRLQRELMGREGDFGRERRQARGASAEMREVYGVKP